MIITLGAGEKLTILQNGRAGAEARAYVEATEAGLVVSGGIVSGTSGFDRSLDARVLGEVCRIVEDHLGVPVSEPDVGFEEMGADSLDAVELVMAFEENFGIAISDEDADAVVTVRDACALVERLGG